MMARTKTRIGYAVIPSSDGRGPPYRQRLERARRRADQAKRDAGVQPSRDREVPAPSTLAEPTHGAESLGEDQRAGVRHDAATAPAERASGAPGPSCRGRSRDWGRASVHAAPSTAAARDDDGCPVGRGRGDHSGSAASGDRVPSADGCSRHARYRSARVSVGRLMRVLTVEVAVAAGLFTMAVACSGEGVECLTRVDCASGARCVNGRCSVSDATGDAAAARDATSASGCRDDTECDDGVDCTRDICAARLCVHAPMDDACTGGPDGVCNVALGCRYGTARCEDDAECDDAIACTRDSCVLGRCELVPEDAACTLELGARCIPALGCEVEQCSLATCVAGPCQVARCEGDSCVLEPLCGEREECCGGECVAAGCDDGNPCTDDACVAGTCSHEAAPATCDDGVYCNGADSCLGGECAAHDGNPCRGTTTCSEAGAACLACADDLDCPSPTTDAWSTCAFDSTCDESGSRERMVTSYRCVDAVCVPSAERQTDRCTRVTTGVTCGATTVGAWSACGGYADSCDETGSRARTITEQVCAAGACQPTATTETATCGRSTGGTSCGATTYTAWTACGGFGSTCDTTGTRARTRSDRICNSGTCTDAVATESQSCARSTDGISCGSTTYGAWSGCGGYADACDEGGSRTRSRTDRTCASGTCVSAVSTETGGCTRSTDGSYCEDISACATGHCDGGNCLLGHGCTGTQRCCEPGMCVCATCFCN